MGCVSSSKPQHPLQVELKPADEKTKESTIPVSSQVNTDHTHLALSKAASLQGKDMIMLSKQKLQSIVYIESPKHSHASNLINHNIRPSKLIDALDCDMINDQNVAPFAGIDLSLHFRISIHKSPLNPSNFPKEPSCNC